MFNGYVTYFDSWVSLLTFKIDATRMACTTDNWTTIECTLFEKRVFSTVLRRVRDVSPTQKDHYNLPKTNRADVSTVVNFRFRFHRHSARFYNFEIVSPRWCVFTEHQRCLFEVIPLNVTVRHLDIIIIFIIIGTRLVPRKCRHYFPTAFWKHHPRHSWSENCMYRRVSLAVVSAHTRPPTTAVW